MATAQELKDQAQAALEEASRLEKLAVDMEAQEVRDQEQIDSATKWLSNLKPAARAHIDILTGMATRQTAQETRVTVMAEVAEQATTTTKRATKRTDLLPDCNERIALKLMCSLTGKSMLVLVSGGYGGSMTEANQVNAYFNKHNFKFVGAKRLLNDLKVREDFDAWYHYAGRGELTDQWYLRHCDEHLTQIVGTEEL